MSDLDILRTDQPESPDRTRDLGNIVAKAVRALNYSTLGGAPGLECPADAYDLLGALCAATGWLPQLCEQLARFLQAQDATGTLADNRGRDPAVLADAAGLHLEVAAARAADLTTGLRQAQNAISGLYVRETGDDGG